MEYRTFACEPARRARAIHGQWSRPHTHTHGEGTAPQPSVAGRSEYTGGAYLVQVPAPPSPVLHLEVELGEAPPLTICNVHVQDFGGGGGRPNVVILKHKHDALGRRAGQAVKRSVLGVEDGEGGVLRVGGRGGWGSGGGTLANLRKHAPSEGGGTDDAAPSPRPPLHPPRTHPVRLELVPTPPCSGCLPCHNQDGGAPVWGRTTAAAR